MSDFASAAMVRVLVQGMRQHGLQPPAQAALAGTRAATSATVALALKREVVASALQQGGLACLPLLGRGLQHFRNDPTHRALATAQSAGDLFARWARLERYIHSSHRCELLSIVAHEARVQHVAKGGAPPLVAESLVVLGLLAALLEAMGLNGVQAWAGGAPVFPQPDAAALARVAARHGAAAQWRLAWRGRASQQSSAAAPPPKGGPVLADLLPPDSWPAPLHDCARVLLAELPQSLPLPVLAQRLGWAPRSLQRQLSRQGLGYAELLVELRCRAGAWWLLNSQASIAELGFLSGYADQAHFTRELQRRVGMTPARYRAAFAATEAAPAGLPQSELVRASL
jgi:AraC-like DNA-binding protein